MGKFTKWTYNEKVLLRKLFREAKATRPEAKLKDVLPDIKKHFPNRSEKQVCGAMTNFWGNWTKVKYGARTKSKHKQSVVATLGDAVNPNQQMLASCSSPLSTFIPAKTTWHVLFNNGVEVISSAESPSDILGLLNESALKNIISIGR